MGKIFLAIIAAVVIGTAGIFFYKQFTKSKDIQPAASVIPAITPSPSPLLTPNPASPSPLPPPEAQLMDFPGFPPFSAFSILVPNKWNPSKEAIGGDGAYKVTFTNNGYQLIITQGPANRSQCTYPGQAGDEMSAPFNQPVAVNGKAGQFNRAAQPGGPANTYLVCQQKNGSYTFPTDFGYVSYVTPQNPSDVILAVMDQMLASVTKK